MHQFNCHFGSPALHCTIREKSIPLGSFTCDSAILADNNLKIILNPNATSNLAKHCGVIEKYLVYNCCYINEPEDKDTFPPRLNINKNCSLPSLKKV